MTTEEIVEKAMDDLSVMINRSFNIVFEKLGTLDQKLAILDDKLNILDTRIAAIEKDVSELTIKVVRLETHASQTNKRLDLIDKKIWLAGLSFNQEA